MASLRIAGNCHKSFCNNRGTCEIDKKNSKKGFSCHCSTGWLGDKCENNVNSSTAKFERYIAQANAPRAQKIILKPRK